LLRNYNNLGIVFQSLGNNDSTLKYFGKAAQLAEKDEPNFEGAIKHNMGMIYITKTETVALALKMFSESLIAHKKADKQLGEATNLLYIGDCYSRMENYSPAIENFKLAVDLSKEKGY